MSHGAGGYTTHQGDGNPTQRLTSTLLNGKNYLSWVRAATISLMGKGKFEFVNGKMKKLADEKDDKGLTIPNTKQDEWVMNDNLVMSWLLNSIEPTISGFFIFSNSSQEI